MVSVRQIANRAKRELIARPTPVRTFVNTTYETRLRRHRPRLPRLTVEDKALVDRLCLDGVAVTDLDALHLDGTPAVQGALDRLRQRLAETPRGQQSTLRPARDDLLHDVALWRWGLDERLLDIVENYIGLPVRYYGADVRCEVANGETVGVRQWHRDVEDHRMFKILVWLDDVGPGGGPFEYVLRSHTADATHSLRYVSGFVSDERMSMVVPATEWFQGTGPQWTAVVADTTSVFHRAQPPQGVDRYSVTFTWTSRHPVKTVESDPLGAHHVRRLTAGLNGRQLACLPDEERRLVSR